MAFQKDEQAKGNHDSRIEFTLARNAYDPARVIPLTDLYRDLDLALRKDLFYHYSGAISALYWIALCRHPEYGHVELVDLVDCSLRELHSALSAQTSLSFVSLGPGDGEIDLRILRYLEDSFIVPCYYCIDFSFELLRYAVFRISTANELKKKFRIKAICGNFAEPDGLLAREEGARLFGLTGFTLGNYNEADLLGKIGQLMTDNDFLLVDAHLHGLKSLESRGPESKQEMMHLLGCYSQEAVNRFVFGPVEAATTASMADVTFDCRIHRQITSVPNALNVTICCKDLQTKMRFTGEPIERGILDLASTTFYSYTDLREWFLTYGFQCVWEKQAGPMALFLLKRSGSAITRHSQEANY